MIDQWRRWFSPLLVLLFVSLAGIGACTQEVVDGTNCPPGMEYDDELQRCVDEEETNSSPGDDAGVDTDASASQDAQSADDTGGTDTGGLDTGGSDTGGDDAGTTDTGTTDTGTTDTGTTDTGQQQDAGQTEDTGSDSGDDDSGGGPPPECGGDLWDDTHDGSDPWEDPLIDCGDLRASWSCSRADGEAEVVELVNEMRSEEQTCGTTSYPAVDPVEMNDELQCAARIHSWDMAGRDYFSHTTPEGVSFATRISLAGGSSWGGGENIASGTSSPESIVNLWMNSPGHCANIMKGSYATVGVGIYGGYATLKFSGASN